MEELIRAVPSLLDEMLPDGWDRGPLVFAAWRKTAGEPLRKRTLPVKYCDRRLTVAVEDRVWKRHLEDLSGEILYRLSALLGHGVVTFLEFRVDKDLIERAAGMTPRNSAERKTRISTSHPAYSASAAIEDQTLRESFLEFAAVSQAKTDRQQERNGRTTGS